MYVVTPFSSVVGCGIQRDGMFVVLVPNQGSKAETERIVQICYEALKKQ